MREVRPRQNRRSGNRMNTSIVSISGRLDTHLWKPTAWKKGLFAPFLPIPSREKLANRSTALVASMPSVCCSSGSGDS